MRAARAVCWGFALGEDRGYDLLDVHFNPRCEPPWSEADLRRKCAQAMDPNFKHTRGWLLNRPLDRPAGPSPTGRRSQHARPSSTPDGPAPVDDASAVVADPAASSPPPPVGQGSGVPAQEPAPAVGVEEDDPFRLAALYLAEYPHADGCTLRYWNQDWIRWRDGAYDRLSPDHIRADVARFVEDEFRRLHRRRVRQYEREREKGDEKAKQPKKQRVTRNLIGDVLDAMRGTCILPYHLTPPCWVDSGPDPSTLIATRNGIVSMPAIADGDEANAFTPATPRFFSTNRIAFDFDAAAPAPAAWLQFLADIWPNDPQSIDCLQEWFGYLLTPDTRQHKMLMLVGPPRAGKGTIGRILKALVGERNIAAPSLSDLTGQFGLQDLVGKSIAIISDARLSGRADAVMVTEQLLSISGEDARTIDRKHREPITLKLNTRFVFFSNELPRFGDASGAIVDRLVIVRLTRSFLGEEDTGLTNRLLADLPGILLWAIAGWARLRATGRFTIPDSAAELIADTQALASPIKSFMRDCCEVGNEDRHVTATKDLYEAWRSWCKRQGREHPGTCETFIRDLRAAVPTLASTKPRQEGKRVHSYHGIRILSVIETGEIEL